MESPVSNEKGPGIEAERLPAPVPPDSTASTPTQPIRDFVPTTVEEDDFHSDDPDEYPDYYPSGIIADLAANKGVNIEEKREDTRGRLAVIYTVATFVMFFLGFVAAVADAMWRQTSIIENLNTILPLISGLFLGSLGFVLGYYFRKSEDEG